MKKAIVVFILLISSLSAFAQSSFLELCKTGTPEQIEAALKAGASIRQQDADGWTPIHFAAGYNRNPKTILVLLSFGASLTAKTREGWTPYDLAVSSNLNFDVASLLLGAKDTIDADKNSDLTSIDEWTPVSEFLLKHGISLYESDSNGYNALHVALEEEKGSVKFFL